MLGAEAIVGLIKWAVGIKDLPSVFERLEGLAQTDLAHLNSAVGIASLKHALKQWRANKENNKEESWQQLLSTQSFVLEQVFSVPVVMIKSKAYVGGKSILNTGGSVVDFLVKNEVTHNVALVEIKTPTTRLLGGVYRDGVYGPSAELSGAIVQVLACRDSLVAERCKLLGEAKMQAEAFDPQCVVIAGHAKEELSDAEKNRSFELFRRQLNDVRIITYDEMYDRTKRLITVLENGL